MRAFVRNYALQPFTGYPVSTVPAGQWHRGVLFRGPSLALDLPPAHLMRDPSLAVIQERRGRRG